MKQTIRTSSLLAAPLLAALFAGAPVQAAESEGLKLARQNACMACHGVSNKIVGPAFTDIAARYKSDANAAATLATKIKAGGSGTWGAVPMPPQAQLKDGDLNKIVGWILGGAK